MPKKHGRGRDRRPRRPPVVRRGDTPARAGGGAENQELFQQLRQALRSAEPLALLAIVAGFLEATDERNANPFARDKRRVSLAELVESFVGTPYAETTAALTALRVLMPEDPLATVIDRELATRTHPMPPWLASLGQARLEPEVWFLTHVLGDGDDYLLGVTLPTGQALTSLVYVDHNMGTIVKDAFVVPELPEDVALRMGTLLEDRDQSLTRTDGRQARAAIEAAIAHGAMMYPPVTSEQWPMCRPLVEWMVRMLPEGGVAPEWREWTEDELQAVAHDFFSSPYGAAHDDPDGRSLLESLLWFGTSYANGDPFRWSAVTVELLLVDWVPRKIVAEPAYLSPLPDLARSFIRFAHEREGIRDDLTTETLAAVDAYEPEYQRLIRSDRPQGPAALLVGMFGHDEGEDDDDERSIADIMLEGLDRKVGGRLVLMRLDDAPLPDEPFEWAGVPEDIHDRVREILELCDRCADELLDVEHRTAMRRFLGRAAVGDPAIFRRRASSARGAAAVAWAVGSANGTFDRTLLVQDLLAWFGVSGSVSQRAEPFLRANGVDPHGHWGRVELAAPDLLVAQQRRDIIDTRDRWLGE